MSDKSIRTDARDPAETGLAAAAAAAVDEFYQLGLDRVTMAGSCGAGRFMRPRGKGGEIHFPEIGRLHFNADPSRCGAIKPATSNAPDELRGILRPAHPDIANRDAIVAAVQAPRASGLSALGDPAESGAMAGLIAMTRAIAMEYGRHGIRAIARWRLEIS